MKVIGYAVVGPEGEVYRNRGDRLCIYRTVGPAKRLAGEGDAVVEVTIDLSREPLFIRARKVDA